MEHSQWSHILFKLNEASSFVPNKMFTYLPTSHLPHLNRVFNSNTGMGGRPVQGCRKLVSVVSRIQDTSELVRRFRLKTEMKFRQSNSNKIRQMLNKTNESDIPTDSQTVRQSEIQTVSQMDRQSVRPLDSKSKVLSNC